ncbi:SpoIIE family protein phosphatase [Streptomyces spiralis]
MRQRQLVWLDSQEELARRYPQLGSVLPYDFMLAAAPLTSDALAWGGIALLWPPSHPPQLSRHERNAVTTCCRKAADFLEQATAHGHPLLPTEEPRLLPPPPAKADPDQAQAALAATTCLPVGCCTLDLDGRLTFINPAGADLLGADTTTLIGHRPSDVLLWLHDPLLEDRYRSAMITRRPTSFTAVRPPDTPLLFQLHPSNSGLNVHIAPAAQQELIPSREPAPSDEPANAMALYHLTHLAVTLGEALGVQDVVDLVADQVVPAFGPQGLVVMTAEEERLHVICHRGYSAEFISQFDGTPLASRTPTAYALATGEPAFFATFAEFRHTYPAAPRFEGRNAWAFLPLIASGRLIGSLALSYDEPRAFPRTERAILTSLSGLIAQALGRARLYDARSNLAQTLQTGLLPHALPRVPGLDVAARYVPAGYGMDIGGDFYDLIPNTTPTAAIGDVQGHNATAAALMGQVRTAVRAHATVCTPPGELLACTNRLLTDIGAGLLTSCLIADLDIPHHRARIATAGHPPPLLRRPDGRTQVLRLPPGPLLGIDPDADYPTTEITLPDGAVLALYTDGLVETPGTDIGDSTNDLAQHLAQARSPNLDGIADILIRHAEESAPRHDDIALLLIRPHSEYVQ